MTNYVHLIISSETNKLEHIVRDLKKFTSKQIIKAIQENSSESRQEWMLNIFGYTGKQNNNNKRFQFWMISPRRNHPIELDTAEKYKERLDYLHNNPVTAGIVWVRRGEWHYKYSSAIDYYSDSYRNEKGLLKIEILPFAFVGSL